MSDVRRLVPHFPKILNLAPLFAVAVSLGACGPTLSTSIRTETAFAPGNTGVVEKDGLKVEVPNLKEVPEQFVVEAMACDATGKPTTDPITNSTSTVKVFAVSPGSDVSQVKITNQTDHVVRLQGAVIRLFDPAENPLEPQSKEEVAAAATRGSMLAVQGACPDAANKIRDALTTVRFLGPNTELLPGTTTTGYLVFLPSNVQLPGTWKLSLYEIPVKVDAAGNPVAKTRFDFAYIRKKFEDTYSKEAFGARKLVSSKEVP